MAEQDTLKEFLVKLGWKVDESSAKKAKNTIEDVEKSLNALGLATELSLAAVVAFTVKAADALDKLYFAAQRTGAGADDINAFSYAMSQMGSSTEEARGAIESLAKFSKTYGAGAGALLETLGVSPEHLGNAEKELEDLGRTFENLKKQGKEQLGLQYANLLGIPYKVFLALEDGSLNKNIEDYRKRLSAAGLSEEDAARSGNELMSALRAVGSDAQILGESLVNGPLGKALTWIVKEIDEVAKGLSKLLNNPSEALTHDLPEGLKKWGLVYSTADNPTEKGQDTSWNRVVNHFKNKGYSPEQAIGMAAGFKGESATFNPKELGDYVNGKPTAIGIGQWHEPRQKDFKRIFNKDLIDASLEEQLQFADWELQNTEWKTAAQVHDAKDARQAAERFVGYFRPADRLGAERLRGDIAEKASVNVTQTNTVNLTGVGADAAQRVADVQKDVNSQLVRNVQGAVR